MNVQLSNYSVPVGEILALKIGDHERLAGVSARGLRIFEIEEAVFPSIMHTSAAVVGHGEQLEAMPALSGFFKPEAVYEIRGSISSIGRTSSRRWLGGRRERVSRTTTSRGRGELVGARVDKHSNVGDRGAVEITAAIVYRRLRIASGRRWRHWLEDEKAQTPGRGRHALTHEAKTKRGPRRTGRLEEQGLTFDRQGVLCRCRIVAICDL